MTQNNFVIGPSGVAVSSLETCRPPYRLGQLFRSFQRAAAGTITFWSCQPSDLDFFGPTATLSSC